MTTNREKETTSASAHPRPIEIETLQDGLQETTGTGRATETETVTGRETATETLPTGAVETFQWTTVDRHTALKTGPVAALMIVNPHGSGNLSLFKSLKGLKRCMTRTTVLKRGN